MQSKDGFKTVKDVALYFHSSFRNVGLYTSLSLASLAAANTYAKDSPTTRCSCSAAPSSS